jgi:hypothetical protein
MDNVLKHNRRIHNQLISMQTNYCVINMVWCMRGEVSCTKQYLRMRTQNKGRHHGQTYINNLIDIRNLKSL